MGKILGNEAEAPQTAESGFFVAKNVGPQKPTAEQAAAANAVLNEFFYGEQGEANARQFDEGRGDVVHNRMGTDAARTYIRIEGLLGVAHSAHDRLPGVSVEQLADEQIGGSGA